MLSFHAVFSPEIPMQMGYEYSLDASAADVTIEEEREEEEEGSLNEGMY